MSVALTYTVQNIVFTALSEVGVDGATTESKNVEDAHRAFNLLMQEWAADPDMAIHGMVPPTGYTALSDTVDLPPEYIAAAVPNLAMKIAPQFDQPVSKVTIALAGQTLAIIKSNNIKRNTGRIQRNLMTP